MTTATGEPDTDNPTLQQRFEAFHTANPRVFAVLESLAAQWLAGHSKVGIKMLWEVARWKLDVETVGDDVYRLNNDYTARYARLLLVAHPEWSGRIETRVLRAA